ncbi:transcriptional regulator, HxlR family [Streptomyces sp. OV198]|uniref:winged helix-turn-helix transcriptional regulator n=1 Tax=Streptomyces sp. OV198 TaxID=1882787 RepID=UPI000BCFC82D|nr:helix-turn-helix domain-containing protein [Streptomyces sp. OV198]SOE78540.1 transcriptional regulator, HxlR family [Streptomyces sp. OV198]
MTNPSAQTDPQDPQDPGPSPTIHALTRAFALLGKRWNGLVLAALAQGPAGFGEVRERVPGISDRMLADRLHELAVAGLLTRTVQPSNRSPRTTAALRGTPAAAPRPTPPQDPGGAAVRTVSRRGPLSPG